MEETSRRDRHTIKFNALDGFRKIREAVGEIVGSVEQGNLYSEGTEYGIEIVKLAEEAKALQDKLWKLSRRIDAIPDIPITKDDISYEPVSDKYYASLGTRCTASYPKTFGNCANEYGVLDVMIAKGIVEISQTDFEHSGTHIYFQSEEEVEEFIKKFNEYVALKKKGHWEK